MKRRYFFKKCLFWGLAGGVSIPLFSFLTKERFRPPIEYKINKKLKVGEYLIESAFVLFMEKQGPMAISRKCTHLGCRLNFIDKIQGFICPCHQSRFFWYGKYIKGPAKKDLQRFPVKSLKRGQGFIVYLPR